MGVKRKQGFTLVEISIVVSVIGLLAAVGIPSLKVAREKSQQRARASNARLLNDAVEMWSMDNPVSDSSRIRAGITNYIRGGLGGLSVGGVDVRITNITSRTVGHTFTVDDLY